MVGLAGVIGAAGRRYEDEDGEHHRVWRMTRKIGIERAELMCPGVKDADGGG